MERFPYAELINDILRTGERRVVGSKRIPVPIEITFDGKGHFIGVPLFHCDGVNNKEKFEKVVRDLTINLKINPGFLVPNESKNISLEFHEMGKRISISIYKSSVMLTSGIEEMNAVREIPHILACAALYSCIYYWMNPQMLEVAEDGTYYFAFGFKFLSPYVLNSELPLLEKIEKTDVKGRPEELFELRIVADQENPSNLTVEDFWMDPMWYRTIKIKAGVFIETSAFLILDFYCIVLYYIFVYQKITYERNVTDKWYRK